MDGDTITLKAGQHNSLEDGACLLELTSYLAGEPWSDHPACVSPVLAAFGRTWTDGLRNDEERTRLLLPFAQRLIGTVSTPEVEERRSYLALDWLIRTHTPAWLRLVPTLTGHAGTLTALPEIVDLATATNAQPFVAAARDAARAALEATVLQLQSSAVVLFHSMIEVAK